MGDWPIARDDPHPSRRCRATFPQGKAQLLHHDVASEVDKSFAVTDEKEYQKTDQAAKKLEKILGEKYALWRNISFQIKRGKLKFISNYQLEIVNSQLYL